MDIISHGLWGGVAVGRGSKKIYWAAFFASMLPDLLSFGLYTIDRLLGITVPGGQVGDPHQVRFFPAYLTQMYNITHSLVVFGGLFLLLWLLRRKPVWLMLVWLIHILIDIPTHSFDFFPTPFLWPLSDFKINGISWGEPVIFFPNLVLLLLIYLTWWFFRYKERRNIGREGSHNVG